MWTSVVIEAEIRAEGGRPPRGAAIGHAIGPLAEQGLDKALGLAVGLRSIGAGVALADRPGAADATETTRAIRHGVVGEQSADADPASAKPGQRALEKARAGRRVARGEDLGIGEPGGVIDRHMQELPPD